MDGWELRVAPLGDPLIGAHSRGRALGHDQPARARRRPARRRAPGQAGRRDLPPGSGRAIAERCGRASPPTLSCAPTWARAAASGCWCADRGAARLRIDAELCGRCSTSATAAGAAPQIAHEASVRVPTVDALEVDVSSVAIREGVLVDLDGPPPKGSPPGPSASSSRGSTTRRWPS